MKVIVYVFLLLNQQVMAEDVKSVKFHENYGVFWTHQGVLEPMHNVWHHTFAVEISSPELTEIEVPCETSDGNEFSTDD